MQFNSWQFAIFLPIVFFIYYALNHKYRWMLLLGASYFFYMYWDPKLVVLIATTTLVSYACAIKMDEADSDKSKKGWMLVGVLTGLVILFFFKYFNFFSRTVTSVLRMMEIPARDYVLDLMLPVGISFYTFQTLSYVFEVYRGNMKAERHLGLYALYVSFFPQLVDGPIERPGNMLPQYKEETKFSYDEVTYGLKLMAWGFFKKMVIASSLAVYVDMVFDAPQEYEGLALIIASVFFTIQIYCDFSGYSDIAVGTARLFGKNIMQNFKAPYFAKSIKEFWGRWHISLSTWFRDYVYIPLGGNRVSSVKHKWNLMITFLTSGLWHGANWTFVVWGGLHGMLQVIEGLWREKYPRDKDKTDKWYVTAGRILVTFSLVSFAWIFFRANNFADAWYVITHLFDKIGYPMIYLLQGFRSIGLTKVKLAGVVMPVLLLILYDYYDQKSSVIDKISSLAAWKRWLIYVAFVSGIIIFVAASYGNVSQEFIYSQF